MGQFYGNYAGPNWTGGRNVAPGERGEYDIVPTDPSDALARDHDWGYANADDAKKEGDMASYYALRHAADLALIEGAKKRQKELLEGGR